jgi:hypothetical protein
MAEEPDLFSQSVRFDRFSQNGEDGVIAALFDRLGVGERRCCEFGAWDGIHLSNCRNLVQQGWECLFIEGDARRYDELVRNYAGNGRVHTACAFVDCAGNDIERLVRSVWLDGHLDLLSIDIDGLDYEILRNLRLKPRVICIEVNAGHSPLADAEVPASVARDNVGQPLNLFVRQARKHGYGLVGFTGNAFFVRLDEMERVGWLEVAPIKAYRKFLSELATSGKEWLYLVNLGLVPPYHKFRNNDLSAKDLHIGWLKCLFLIGRAHYEKMCGRALLVARQIKRLARAIPFAPQAPRH